MTQFLNIEKTGDIKDIKISNINELYKKCGFRKDNGFEKIINWEKKIDGKNTNIELWGRTSGKNNIKNNYKFPEPFNKNIYGNCSLIYKEDNEIFDLTEELWNKMYIVDNTTQIEVKSDETILDDSNNNGLEYDNNIDSDIDDISISNNEDSELQEESYIYSSEEENTN